VQIAGMDSMLQGIFTNKDMFSL